MTTDFLRSSAGSVTAVPLIIVANTQALAAVHISGTISAGTLAHVIGDTLYKWDPNDSTGVQPSDGYSGSWIAMILGSAGGTTQSAKVVSGTYNVLNTDYVVVADTSQNVVNINLPASAQSGQMFIVKDIGCGSVRNVNISDSLSRAIEDGTTYTISINRGSVHFVLLSNRWIVV